MFELLGKKIITLLRSNYLLNRTYAKLNFSHVIFTDST